MSTRKIDVVVAELAHLFPDAKCELNYHNVYELSVAVILSAQTTDKAVNLVTPALFKTYPDLKALSEANVDEVAKVIARIGMAQTKAKNIIGFALMVIDKYNSIIPQTIDELITLPGVGSKTANVIISEGYGIPGFAVDVHVTRVTNRLGLVNTNNPLKIEKEMKAMMTPSIWHIMHHRFIFMGRYLCKAKNPLCQNCSLYELCQYEQKSQSIIKKEAL